MWNGSEWKRDTRSRHQEQKSLFHDCNWSIKYNYRIPAQLVARHCPCMATRSHKMISCRKQQFSGTIPRNNSIQHLDKSRIADQISLRVISLAKWWNWSFQHSWASRNGLFCLLRHHVILVYFRDLCFSQNRFWHVWVVEFGSTRDRDGRSRWLCAKTDKLLDRVLFWPQGQVFVFLGKYLDILWCLHSTNAMLCVFILEPQTFRLKRFAHTVQISPEVLNHDHKGCKGDHRSEWISEGLRIRTLTQQPLPS